MAAFSTLQDNFDDNSINGTLWYTYGLGIAEANQHAEFTTQTSAQYSGWGSNSAYDLTGSYVMLQLFAMGDRTIVSLEIQPINLFSGTNALDFYLNQTTILARKKVTGSTTTVATETFSATGHAWLRIRETGGTTYWEKSSDGINWTTMHSEANPITVTSLQNETVVGEWQAEASTTVVKFDNFNIIPSTTKTLAALGVG